MTARHLPLALACTALAVALVERGHRLAREAEKRRFIGLLRRMADNAHPLTAGADVQRDRIVASEGDR